MKAKKIIIGLVAVVALLITIAGALADPIAEFSPEGNEVKINKTQPTEFSINVTNNPELILTYQWFVNSQLVSDPVSQAGSYVSTFTFDPSTKEVGTYYVSVVVDGEPQDLDHLWTVTVQDPQPASLLSIKGIEVNGKSSGKLTVSELNEIEVEIANDHTLDMEDVEVTVRILDVDGTDLEEDTEIRKIRSGRTETSDRLEFDLSNEEVDEDEYTIEVEVEGEDEDGDKHTDTQTFTVKVDRERDDLIITRVNLQNSQVFCSLPQTSLDVQIKNVGENDQDGARITVKNSALGVDLQRANIDLDDYAGSDNDYEATFALNLEDAKQGAYMVSVAVYNEDNDLMDTEEVELQVQCPEDTSSEEQESEQYADKELAAELQKKIDEYKAMQESQASQGNFRESSSYVLLLGALVAMMFFAAVLSATYMLVKKK